jgi:hypothetical protein
MHDPKGFVKRICESALDRRDPSPGPLRLAKTPAAVHPLPRGEG